MMQMLYNSDNYVVVAFDIQAVDEPARGGYEIVDKFARKEIFLDGALAQQFRQGAQALVQTGMTEEAMDEFIGRYTELAHQPVVSH
jgi:hypothetical protein